MVLIACFCRDKQFEIELGVDGFMVHDVDLIPAVLDMVNSLVPGPNQIHKIPANTFSIAATDLLTLPEVSRLLLSRREIIIATLVALHHRLNTKSML